MLKVLFIHMASENQHKETAIEYVHSEFSLAESDENFDSMLNIFHWVKERCRAMLVQQITPSPYKECGHRNVPI